MQAVINSYEIADVWSFFGILISSMLTVVSLRGAYVTARVGNRQLRSAETFRRLQWAVELALDPSEPRAATGMAALDGLVGSAALDDDDYGYVSGIMEIVIAATMAASEEGM